MINEVKGGNLQVYNCRHVAVVNISATIHHFGFNMFNKNQMCVAPGPAEI